MYLYFVLFLLCMSFHCSLSFKHIIFDNFDIHECDTIIEYFNLGHLHDCGLFQSVNKFNVQP